MNESKISVRYSRALFESALGKDILDKIYQDMLLIRDVCSEKEMKELLGSPIVPPSKKSEILNAVFAGNIDKLSLSMIDMAVKNSRESFLPGIARVFITSTKEYKGITESSLTTAVKVDEKIKKQITDLISGIFRTKVELNEVVDKEIIGGFVLRVEDSFIDASVRNKLRKIEKELKNKTLLS